MPTRREFLKTTAALVASPLLLETVSTQQQAPASEVFADFESGTYDGWKLSGNCWTPEPASDVLFPGKITGFEGKRFLCTLHPKLGTGATGKAVSKEFTLEKPFINFLIGGGNHPREACLNLVVDGKVVRTETGSDSAELRQVSWDVSLLVGKKAYLEVTDTTQSPERGYVMVDEIIFSEVPLDQRLLDVENGPTLKEWGIEPFFFYRSNVKFTQPYGDRDLSPVFDFGVTPHVFKQLVDVLCVHTYWLPHTSDMKLEDLSRLLRMQVDQIIKDIGITNPSKFLLQWLQGEAICAYVTSKITYDFDTVENTQGKGDERERERWRRQAVDIVYRTQLASCDGFGRITQCLAQLAGIKCWHMDVTLRKGRDGTAWEHSGHGALVFEFEGGIRVPVDTTVPWIGYADYRRQQGKNGWRTMPATKRAWEIYAAEYYQNNVIVGEMEPENLSLITLSFEQWRAFNSLKYDLAKDWYDRQSMLEMRASWLQTPWSEFSYVLDPGERKLDLAYNPGDRTYPRASASYTYQYDRVAWLIDGKINYGGEPRNRWTAYQSPNASDWVQVEFGDPKTVNRVVLHFYADSSGTHLPSDYSVQVWFNGKWTNVQTPKKIPSKPVAAGPNLVTFAPQTVSAVRVTLIHSEGSKSGLTELMVMGPENSLR